MRAAAYRYCIFFFSSPRARKGKEGHTRKIIVMFRSGSAFSFHTGSARTLIKQIWIRNTDSSRVGTRKYCSRKELNTAGAVLGYLQINSRLARYLLEVVVLAALVNLREVSVKHILQLHTSPYVKFAAGQSPLSTLSLSTRTYFARQKFHPENFLLKVINKHHKFWRKK